MRAPTAFAIALATAACGGGDATLTELSDGTINVGAYAVAFDGEAYVVAWTTALSGADDRVSIARVTASGHFLVPPAPVLDAGFQIGQLAVTVGGGRGVVWYRERSDSNAPLHGAVIDAGGHLVGAPEMLGAVLGTSGQSFAVTWTGDRYAVAMPRAGATASEIWVNLYDTELSSTGESAIEGGAVAEEQPCIAWSSVEQRLVVLWREDELIRAARATADLATREPSAIVLDDGARQFFPSIVTTSTGAAIGWSEGSDEVTHRTLRFSTALTSAGPWRELPPDLIDANRYASLVPAMALVGNRLRLAWRADTETALPRIELGALDITTGAALEDRDQLTSGRAPVNTPVVAAGTGETAVVFSSDVDGARRLFFTTVD